MTEFFPLTLPIFGVVGLGWLTQRGKVLPSDLLSCLSWFSFYVALPALVLRLIAQQIFCRAFYPTFFGAYLVVGGIIFGLVFWVSRALMRRGLEVASAHATTATVSNLGFLGPPLMLAVFGDRGAGPLTMGILAEVMVLLSVGNVIMDAAHHGDRASSLLTVRRLLLNPLLIAILVGAGVAGVGAKVPQPIDRFVGFLGGAAAPSALFALGGTLASRRMDRRTVVAATGLTVTKLVLYPALVWCVLGGLLELRPFWVQSGVLIAAMPSAGGNYVLAARNQAEEQVVSTSIVLSTALSVILFPVSAWLVMRS